jgi:hypothetical protein
MEQAQAGSGLVDLPTPHTIPHGNGSNETTGNGSVPEKMSAHSPSQQTVPSKRTRNTKSNRGGVEDIALCASPAGFLTTKSRGHTERESIGGMLRKAMVNHQLGISLNLILLVTLTYILFPSLRERVGSFFTLQYPTGKMGEFSIGPRDVYLVAGYVVLFTGLRAAFMDYLLLPLAGLMGIRSKKLRVRYVRNGPHEASRLLTLQQIRGTSIPSHLLRCLLDLGPCSLHSGHSAVISNIIPGPDQRPLDLALARLPTTSAGHVAEAILPLSDGVLGTADLRHQC